MAGWGWRMLLPPRCMNDGRTTGIVATSAMTMGIPPGPYPHAEMNRTLREQAVLVSRHSNNRQQPHSADRRPTRQPTWAAAAGSASYMIAMSLMSNRNRKVLLYNFINTHEFLSSSVWQVNINILGLSCPVSC
eukprot:TRINITY_DN15868_c0_g1_i6.p1 TRINITY_DN15868_c0_g1~~TRINITY_DN15868_c0_g1_i6.p1  ORF type:complete len:133 (+),score=15.75 TRINITY_DN15868_c0_g1_i6:629-1027(+)